MTQPLIQFKDVDKKFGAIQVLRGANLCIYRGEITTIIGKSGEGPGDGSAGDPPG